MRLTVAASLGLGVFVALQQVGSDASEERDVAAQGPEEQNPITAASRSREIEAALPPKAGLPPRVATERWKVIGDRIVAVSPTEINKSAGEVFQPAPLELQDAEARKGRPTAEWRVRRAATSKAQPAKAFGQRRVGAGSKASTTQVELTPTEQEIVRDLADAGAKLMSSADRAPPPGSASRTTLAESKMAGAAVVPKLKVAPPSPSRSTQVLQRQIFSKDVASAQAVGAPRPLFPASLWGPPRTTSGADQEAPGDPTFGVQLVSVSDEQRALLAWQAYKREFDPALDGLEPVIESARLLDRTVFRVRAVAFTERAEAEAVCAQLQQQGADCLVFRR